MVWGSHEGLAGSPHCVLFCGLPSDRFITGQRENCLFLSLFGCFCNHFISVLNCTTLEHVCMCLQALALKAQGNELYKARKFDEAIEAYNKALELYDGDVSFLTNRCGGF